MAFTLCMFIWRSHIPQFVYFSYSEYIYQNVRYWIQSKLWFCLHSRTCRTAFRTFLKKDLSKHGFEPLSPLSATPPSARGTRWRCSPASPWSPSSPGACSCWTRRSRAGLEGGENSVIFFVRENVRFQGQANKSPPAVLWCSVVSWRKKRRGRIGIKI